MQVNFWPRSLLNCGGKLVLSRGWTAPWLSATSPHGGARPSWDAAGRICGPKFSKNWNARASAKQNGVSENSTATSPQCGGEFNLLRGGNNTKPLVGTQATMVSTVWFMACH